MDSIIHILPEFVANRIAAGEVVNRPASAVKELLENAVDAGAAEIELYVRDAGKTLVQVVDNGCGMSREDAERCFLLHATSKLAEAEDLQHIVTMGFRGEALASIAAIGQLELQTRRAEDEVGTLVVVEGGKILRTESCACPVGTNIKLKNIYFNTPARREFLKSDEVENRYIEEEFNRVALAHPEIKFAFYRDDRRLLMLDRGKISHRIVQTMGKSFEQRLLKVSEALPGVELIGYLCRPDYAVKGRSKQYIFVNSRFIRHYGLSGAVEKAYEGLLPEGKNPVFFLFLKVEPESIDINIHPTKTEIRFKDERLLYGLLMSAAKHTLGVNQVRQTLDFESVGQLPYEYKGAGYVPPAPKIGLQRGYNPFEGAGGASGAGRSGGGSGSGGSFGGIGGSGIIGCSGIGRGSGSGYGCGVESASGAASDYREAYERSFASMMEQSDFRPQPNQLVLDCYNEMVADTRLDFEPGSNEGPATEPDSTLARETSRTGSPRIFQIFNAYIVTPLRSGLAVIDQEAASERVVFNDYRRKTASGGSMPSQSTLFPETVELSVSRAEMLKDVREALARLGWGIEWVGGNTFMVGAVPANLQGGRVQETVEGILDNYAAGLMKQGAPAMQEGLAIAAAAEMAVKRGTVLAPEEMLYWVSRLFSDENPEVSPTGRRIIWLLSEKELQGIFK